MPQSNLNPHNVIPIYLSRILFHDCHTGPYPPCPAPDSLISLPFLLCPQISKLYHLPPRSILKATVYRKPALVPLSLSFWIVSLWIFIIQGNTSWLVVDLASYLHMSCFFSSFFWSMRFEQSGQRPCYIFNRQIFKSSVDAFKSYLDPKSVSFLYEEI